LEKGIEEDNRWKEKLNDPKYRVKGSVVSDKI